MSVKIMSAIFESEDLPPTERLIMLSLADHADDNGRCYPSIARLCRRTGLKERAVQSNIKSLVAKGYVTIIPNAGQGLANLYFIRATPAADAPPQEMHPRTKRTPTPASNAETPAADAPKPSRTIIEPSVSNTGTPEAILCEVASSEAVTSFIAYRRKTKGKALTLTASKRLAAHLRAIFAGGGNTDEALGMAEERGWMTVEPQWYFKSRNASDGTGNRATGAASQPGRSSAHDEMFAAFQRVAARHS